MAVPDNTTFSMFDVTMTIYGDVNRNRNLNQCFSDASSSWFNPDYSGSKNQLLNFRDYRNRELTPHHIGDSYGGGIIWSISVDETTGIICNTALNPLNCWSLSNDEVGGTYTEWNYGFINTQRIVDFYPSASYAAHDCYTADGWHLPSADEMFTLLTVANGYGIDSPFAFIKFANPTAFLTSSEYDIDRCWSVYRSDDYYGGEIQLLTIQKVLSTCYNIACKYVTF